VQFLLNSGHLLRRYGENNEDVFFLTNFSHADNSAEKDSNECVHFLLQESTIVILDRAATAELHHGGMFGLMRCYPFLKSLQGRLVSA
jgi:hypothetical protein